MPRKWEPWAYRGTGRQNRALNFWLPAASSSSGLAVCLLQDIIEHLHIYIQKSSEHTKTSSNSCAPNFFFSLPAHLIRVPVDIRGGEKQPACCLSRTLSSHLILQEHHGWLPNLVSCSWPQPGKISLGRTARLSAKITILHWAQLVRRQKMCSFIVQPVQQVIRAETIAIHLLPKGPSRFLHPGLKSQCTSQRICS